VRLDQGHSGTMLVNNHISGTMLVNEGISGTMLVNHDPSATLVVNPSGTVQAGRSTLRQGGEDFAAALRSNAPAETSG
jgi:hypothetical protein